MSRQNQILAGILLLQLMVLGVVYWPRSVASGAGESLLPGLEASQVVGLTVTDAEGASLALAAQAGGWVLPEADDYPALADKVPGLLTQIIDLKSDRLVAQSKGSHARLKVAEGDFERQLDLELADGTQQRLYVGTSPSYRAAHVRLEGQDQVYLISGLSASDLPTAPASWVERIYFQVPEEELVAVTLENANGRFDLRKTDDVWMLVDVTPDETANEANIRTVVSRARSVSLLRPLGKTEEAAYGMDAPSAVVTLRAHTDGEGDRTYTLRVGAKQEEDNSYVVISSESPYYVRVSEFTVRELVENTRDDFLELPPTPTPGVTPEATPQG